MREGRAPFLLAAPFPSGVPVLAIFFFSLKRRLRPRNPLVKDFVFRHFHLKEENSPIYSPGRQKTPAYKKKTRSPRPGPAAREDRSPRPGPAAREDRSPRPGPAAREDRSPRPGPAAREDRSPRPGPAAREDRSPRPGPAAREDRSPRPGPAAHEDRSPRPGPAAHEDRSPRPGPGAREDQPRKKRSRTAPERRSPLAPARRTGPPAKIQPRTRKRQKKSPWLDARGKNSARPDT